MSFNLSYQIQKKQSMKHITLKQIKDQGYWKIKMRERERDREGGNFDSRYKKQTCSDKKIFPITNTY